MFGGLNTSRNRIGFAYTSRYNPYVTYGVGADTDLGKYNIRWLRYGDAADTSVVFKIQLDKAAAGGETFQVVFTTENGAWGNDWSWTCDTATAGNTTVTVTLSAGQTEVNFTMIAEVAGNNWRPNRIVTATLQNPSATLLLDPDREVQKLALIPAQDPPKIRISTAQTGFSVATGGSQLKVYTLTLNKDAPLEVPQRVILQGPLAPYCTVTDSSVSAGSKVRNNGITCDVDAAVAAGLGVGDGVSVLLDYERSDVAFQEIDWDPEAEKFEADPYLGTNLLDPASDWTIGTGSVNGWTAKGNGEDERALRTTPHGTSEVCWVGTDLESANVFDGGFATPTVDVDPTASYRYSVWCKASSTAGSWMWGFEDGPRLTLAGASSNYFRVGIDLPSTGDWYLVVGYIRPYDYSGTTTDSESGIWSTSGTQYEAINFADHKWNSINDTDVSLRTTNYQNPSDAGDEIQLWDPRLELVNSEMPSVAELLNQFVPIYRDVHADENLWQWSNDLVAGGTETGEDIPIALQPTAADLPKFPGLPTPAIYDGTTHSGDSWGQGGARPQAQVWEQDDPSPVLDPLTGNPLKIYGPDQYADGMPYVRESFSKVFCGGPLTAHQSRLYMRMSFVIEYMQGVDAGRNMEFHRVGIRIREANRNHGAVFRSSVNMPDPLSDGRIGRDRFGNATQVYGPFDGVKFWLWDYGYDMAPQECGVVADENGHPRLWYSVMMDPSVVYPPPSFTSVPDDVGIFCNPIQYPQWFQTNDGTNVRADGATDRTFTVDQIRAQRLGALWHSMMFEMSDTPFNGAPDRFWPKMSHNGWAPLGNASLENDPAYSTAISLVLEA